MKKLILFLAAICFLASCSNKFSLQKRRYNKGFYFASNHKAVLKADRTNNLAKPKLIEKSNVAIVGEQVARQGLVSADNTATGKALTLNSEKKPLKKQVVKLLNQPFKQLSKVESVNRILLKDNGSKQNIGIQSSKNRSKRDFIDAIVNLYVGYVVVALIVLFVFAVQEFGFLVALGYAVAIILAVLILYWIGSLFTGT